MKKLLLFIICVMAFPLVAEELTFVTTMGAKIGSFNRLDTVNPNKTIDLKKLNFGGANISGGSINLKGNASTIGTLNINANKVSSPKVAVYQLASMTVRPDTTLKGKGLLAGTVTSSAKRMELTVGEVLYNTVTATVQGAKTPNLQITGKAYITGGGMGADMVWSNKYQPESGDDKVYLLKGRSSSTCIPSATYTETPVIGGKDSYGGWEVPEGIPYNTCYGGNSHPGNFNKKHVCSGNKDYTCTDSYYEDSDSQGVGRFVTGYLNSTQGSANTVVAYIFRSSGSPYGATIPVGELRCDSNRDLYNYDPDNLPVADPIYDPYLYKSSATYKYSSVDETKEWINLCYEDFIDFDFSNYGGSDDTQYRYPRHTLKATQQELNDYCDSLARYKEPGLYGLHFTVAYQPCRFDSCYVGGGINSERIYMAAIGWCKVEPAREYYTGSVQCCAD